VPVEVTSFLLNEKRTEITKIELKQRVTVLLVPNPHLETPNYKLERLRHDDPRLENLQASYSMIEEPDEEVGITRREKAKAKPEPVIKGILPEEPAPVAQPSPAAPEPVRVAAPVAASQPAPAAGRGFFAWVKSLFAGESAPAPAPASVPAALAAGGERGARGAARGERGRGERGPRGGERGERGGRDGRGEPRRGERGERSGGASESAARDAAAARAQPRGEPDAEGRGRQRGPRGEPRRGEANGVPATPPGDERSVPAAGLPEAASATEASENADEQRGERGRRRRRRGGRDRDESRAAAANDASINGEPIDEAERPAALAEQSAANDEPFAARHDAAPAEERGEREGGRRRRGGRERYRQDSPPADDEPRAYDVPESAAQAAAPLAAIEAAPAEPAPASVEAAAVPAEPFVLPTEQLIAVAESAGLEWVRSDEQKIRAAQEALAAMPPAVHVPRERKPPVAIDEGPLVLVETRKDLSQVRLPFEVS